MDFAAAVCTAHHSAADLHLENLQLSCVEEGPGNGEQWQGQHGEDAHVEALHDSFDSTCRV